MKKPRLKRNLELAILVISYKLVLEEGNICWNMSLVEGNRSRTRVMVVEGRGSRGMPRAWAPPSNRGCQGPDRPLRTARRRSCSARRTPHRRRRGQRAPVLEGQVAGEGGVAGTGSLVQELGGPLV